MEKLSGNTHNLKNDLGFKEYIKTIKLEDFLRFDEIEANLNINVDQVLGGPEDIFRLLRNNLYHENVLLIGVEKKVEQMDKNIEYYRSFILEDRKSKKKKRKVKKIYLTENVGSDLDEIEEGDEDTDDYDDDENLDTEILPSDLNQKAIIEKPNSSITRKTINDCVYPGFNSKELTELAGFQETPQLLNNLSAKMGFKSSFMRYWSPIIRSEASCAIIQDSFWWFFLIYFKKNPELETDAYKYFSRISDSFVALFMSVDSSIRDRFFGHYANFLSQAIYMAFYKAFSDSRLLLNDDFKNELSNTVHEWILGIKPIPESFKEWEITPDINLSNNTDIKVTSTGEILQKISNLERLLKNLGDKEKRVHSVKFDRAQKPATPVKTFKRLNVSFRRLNRLMSSVDDNKNKFITSFYERNQSHVVGEGAVVEKIPFNLKGQSILISHYLKIHNIQSDAHGSRMLRSQITKQPTSNDLTYKNLIDESLDRQKTFELEFKKATSQVDMDVKKRLNSSVKFSDDNKELDEKHNRSYSAKSRNTQANEDEQDID